MATTRTRTRAITAVTCLLMAACAGQTVPMSPTPTVDPPIANVYILPGAGTLGPNAFGDEPVVIIKGERMRWRNLDTVEHNVTADSASLPEFETTGLLAPGDERSFVMATPGTTSLHCTLHPQETGTLVVR